MTVGISDVQTVAQALTVTGPGVGAVVAYAVVAVVLFTISPLLAAGSSPGSRSLPLRSAPSCNASSERAASTGCTRVGWRPG